MSERPPVIDWMSDWDHMDARWTNDPYSVWSEVRSATCPIARTARYGGAYLPTTFDDIRDIALNTEHFSSRQVVLREHHPIDLGGAPPITTDPPKHELARRAIMEPFSPYHIKKKIPRIREICNVLIDAFIDNGNFDGASDYAQHIPVHVIADMLGLPHSDDEQFRTWIKQILITGVHDERVLNTALLEITEYFRGHVEARRRAPGEDFISHLARQTYEDGEPFKDKHILGTLRLILVAGIDTTWSAIGSSIWHLAHVPSDRERLSQDPEFARTAVEELLRVYAPVTMARFVAKDININGCAMRAGEMALLPFPAANRDPTCFADADSVDFDRQDSHRHVAFGIGIHRCVGMHLARMELTVALQELLKRVPNFQLAGKTTWSQGAVRGPRSLPLVFSTC
ncbi:MAG: cytochrome P450 [Hyphomicrobiaceae bacterium]